MVNLTQIAFLALLFSTSLTAKPLAPEQVPEPLKPWVNWVLQDQKELGCPFIYNSYEAKTCAWPGRLTLDFSAVSGKFASSWTVYRESWVKLPGNQEYWPQNVKVNNKSVAVTSKEGLPSIKLPAGSYQIEGDFFWQHIPESLTIPAATGLLALKVNGNSVAAPIIRDGLLWLTGSETGQTKPENVQNSLDVQAFRLISDDVPMQVTTRLVLDVSGEQREVRLAKPMLDGFVPLELNSQVPARIEPDGQLLVQVRPGQLSIDIVARSTQETNLLSLNSGLKDWPDAEIWAFEAHPELRVVEVEKLMPIDASQTNAPTEWRQYPTYSIKPGESMTLKVIRRGNVDPEPNQLTLRRKLWLDFDGGGYTVHDVIVGKMTKDWRLDAQAETQLGKAALNGSDQLITLNQKSGRPGVEVRQGQIILKADSRRSGDLGKLSATGWEQSFNQVNAELNLPPGWRLLAANGVDNVPDSWIARWTLLDLFLTLLAALAVSKLFGWRWGTLALLTLTLTWLEPGAPQYLWLHILAATALLGVLPQGRLLTLVTWYRNLSWLALLLVVVPFLVDQVRTGIYPQLEYPWRAAGTANQPADCPQCQSEAMADAPVDAMTNAPPAPADSRVAHLAPSYALETESNSDAGQTYEKSKRLYKLSPHKEKTAESITRYDPDAKVQTGPGLPQWQWNLVHLSWNGSVDVNQQLSLWYLSPKMVMLLNFLRVFLVCWLTLVLFGWADKLKLAPKSAAPVILWLLTLPFLALPSREVNASDIPNKEVLEELKNRLLEAPDCLPNCAQIPHLQVNINDQDLNLELQVDAQESVNVPLPAIYEQWFPTQVEMDGKPTHSLFRQGNMLWLNVPAGQHKVNMRGANPVLPAFTLPLTLKPNRVSIAGSGWQVGGVQDNGQVENQLQFNRTRTDAANDKRLAPGVLPSFVLVERKLTLGLDWQVTTTVERLSPADAAVGLEIPLLPGEKVITPGLQVKAGKIQVNLAAQASAFSWESNLNKSAAIEFNAPDTSQWMETWRADISPIWHMEADGIAMVHLNGDGQWLPEWRPWPGEKLTLKITRPKAVEGQTLTIDQSQLRIVPGKRSTDAALDFTIRSSQGAQHTINLPEQAAIKSLTINGQTLPLRQEGRKLTLPVNPGKQDIALTWQQPVGVNLLTPTPTVNLGAPSVNSRLRINLGQDRWVLAVGGPKMGPAVLFWGVLAVILILASGLAKLRLAPLKAWQWFLLLLGLSQVPLSLAAIVIGWLLLLGWRAQNSLDRRRIFNLFQFFLGVTTLVALGVLVLAVKQGLLGGWPDMQISGNQSSAFDLNWYQDRNAAALPTAWAVSIPMLAYRLLMLLWSFWLAASLLDWLKWGWQCFTSNGFWRKKPTVAVNQKPIETSEK